MHRRTPLHDPQTFRNFLGDGDVTRGSPAQPKKHVRFQNRGFPVFLTQLGATTATRPFTARTAPSKVRMARGNAI